MGGYSVLRDALVAKLLVVWKALPTELWSGNGKQELHVRGRSKVKAQWLEFQELFRKK